MDETRLARLWQMVILQAMQDALSRSTNLQETFDRNNALQWLTGETRDFYTVCDYAGMNPNYIRENAKKAIGNGVRIRREMGKAPDYEKRKKYRIKYKKQ